MSVLKVTVTGDDESAVRHTLSRLRGLSTGESVAVRVAQAAVPEAGTCHLVIGVDAGHDRRRAGGDPEVDAWVSGTDGQGELEDLWRQRIVPFATNLAHRRRAPRRRTAVVAEPDPSWPVQADRLMKRLAAALGAHARRPDVRTGRAPAPAGCQRRRPVAWRRSKMIWSTGDTRARSA